MPGDSFYSHENVIEDQAARPSNINHKYKLLKEVTFTNNEMCNKRNEQVLSHRTKTNHQILDGGCSGGEKFQDAKKYMMKTERK